LRKLLARSVSFRAIALAAPVAVVLSAVLAPGLAGAAVTPTGVTDTIHIELKKGALGFVAPQTITQGDELEIVNETNPKQVGPHTFSLVTKGSLPKTQPARKNCFTPKHICLSIAKWQGFNAKEEVTINPAEAGPEGWSTMGTTSKKGDSWFTQKKDESITQQVTAAPGTLYFICAVHPFMQGQVKVVAPQVGVPGV
jgi:plastocyanin